METHRSSHPIVSYYYLLCIWLGRSVGRSLGWLGPIQFNSIASIHPSIRPASSSRRKPPTYPHTFTREAYILLIVIHTYIHTIAQRFRPSADAFDSQQPPKDKSYTPSSAPSLRPPVWPPTASFQYSIPRPFIHTLRPPDIPSALRPECPRCCPQQRAQPPGRTRL